MLFAALARGQRAVYTCPIKALVNEKCFGLCREFGPDHVGMLTGDATVNRDAPILCCTAEMLANIALREGADADVDDVVMDEFHYYADRERGVAWQVPLLTMPQTRFLLMSATLGDTSVFEEAVTRLNRRPTVTVKSGDRPVPLDFDYAEIPLAHTIEKLVDKGQTPVYVVHFTQADAAEQRPGLHQPQDLQPRNRRPRSPRRIAGFRFDSPYGKDVQRWLRHGIGLHHAGLLPKYRVLVEQLAQAGPAQGDLRHRHARRRHQRADPHRALHQAVQVRRREDGHLTVRDFQQIAGRAGRKGFDDRGFVVAQAPEHVIENLRLEREGRARRQEGGQAQAAGAQLRPLGPQHLQAPHRRAARAAGVALPGVARHAAQRARAGAATAAAPCSACCATRTSRTGPRPRTARAPGSCSARSSPATSSSSCRRPRTAPGCASTSTCRTTSR